MLRRYSMVAVPDPQKPPDETEDGLSLTGIETVERMKPELFATGLTPCQERCFSEVLTDMSGPQPMLRLLQGEVGSGKTAVAFLSLMAVVLSKWQGALVSPTEVLARQHYAKFKQWIDASSILRNKPNVRLLTGSTTNKER
jgi:ATP-dependent DNA helicase RecG